MRRRNSLSKIFYKIFIFNFRFDFYDLLLTQKKHKNKKLN